MIDVKNDRFVHSLPALPATLAARPRFALAHLPTPIQPLDRFSKALRGPEIWIKRDDLTGLATGGNKARKLEFLFGDALSKGADAIITAGGPQSNHCRQTAAAAARADLECHLVFGGSSDSPLIGNRFLDQLLGAQEHWTPKGTRDAKMTELAHELMDHGKKPYVIPVGGSNSIGALGYVTAMYELNRQLESERLQFDYLVFATSSGGTQVGIVVGAKLTGSEAKILPISIDQIPGDFSAFVLSVAEGVNSELKLGLNLSVDDMPLNCDYLGQGYGVVGDSEREAITLLARTEGILVDPVYAGRALAGLIDLVRRQRFKLDERVLFWHTGGETALHAYVGDLAHR